MKLYLITAVIISASCVFLGLVELRGKDQKNTRRLFFLMSITMAWFLFSAGNSISSGSKESVILWYRLSSIGYSPFYAFNLHFYISLLNRGRLRRRELLLYLPVPVVFTASMVSQTLFKDFVLTGNTWKFIPAYSSPWFWFYLVYYLSYTLTTIYLIFKRAAGSKMKMHLVQAIIISVFTLLTLLPGSSTDFILSGLGAYSLPPFGPLILGFYIFGLWIVVVRYGFMNPTSVFAPEEILNKLQDMVFLLTPEFEIAEANEESRKVLQLPTLSNGAALFFPDLTATPEQTLQELSGLRQAGEGYTHTCIEYHTTGRPIITNSYCTVIRDHFREAAGYMVISRHSRKLEDFIGEFKLSKRETQVLHYIMRGKNNQESAHLLGIAERTVETHLGHIYNKTGTDNRIELFALAGEYGLSFQIDFASPKNQAKELEKVFSLRKR